MVQPSGGNFMFSIESIKLHLLKGEVNMIKNDRFEYVEIDSLGLTSADKFFSYAMDIIES